MLAKTGSSQEASQDKHVELLTSQDCTWQTQMVCGQLHKTDVFLAADAGPTGKQPEQYFRKNSLNC